MADGRLVGEERRVRTGRMRVPQVAEIADAERTVELQRGRAATLAGEAAAEVVGTQRAAERRSGRRRHLQGGGSDGGPWLQQRRRRRTGAMFEENQATLERVLLDRLAGGDTLRGEDALHSRGVEAPRAIGLDAVVGPLDHRDADDAIVDLLGRQVGTCEEEAARAIEIADSRRGDAQVGEGRFAPDQAGELRLDLAHGQQGDAFEHEAVDADPGTVLTRHRRVTGRRGQRRRREHCRVGRRRVDVEDRTGVRTEGGRHLGPGRRRCRDHAGNRK